MQLYKGEIPITTEMICDTANYINDNCKDLKDIWDVFCAYMLKDPLTYGYGLNAFRLLVYAIDDIMSKDNINESLNLLKQCYDKSHNETLNWLSQPYNDIDTLKRIIE